MALRQAAVLRNAGSYVINPPSSDPALIWRRSVARMAHSLMGISYRLPVRLSVIVSVSAAARAAGWSIFVGAVSGLFIGILYRFGRHAIAAVDPPGQILELAALAAERHPGRLRGLAAAEHTQARAHAHILWY